MSPQVYTIAEAFRDAGYRTAMSGKWHLGVNNMRPEEQGFESVYCIYMSNNQNRDVIRDGKLVREKWDNRLLTETFADEAIRVIREKSEKPFFLYVPWSAPHFHADPHPDWHGKSGEDQIGKFTDVVEELDYRVGRILDALKEAGKSGNTIVIFTSDNGREGGQARPNDEPPFSGRKWQSLEGGTRVPFIIRYPNVVPAGKESDQILAAIDLFPTLADACGIEVMLPDGAQKFDGVNAWRNLKNIQSDPARDELLYWHGKGEATAIRQGDWKLYFNQGRHKHADPALIDGPALYNLKNDHLESQNMAGKHPGKVKALLARAKEKLSDVYEHQVPIGTSPGKNPPEPPLKASDVWGEWIK
jgi:arylsulfatase